MRRLRRLRGGRERAEDLQQLGGLGSGESACSESAAVPLIALHRALVGGADGFKERGQRCKLCRAAAAVAAPAPERAHARVQRVTILEDGERVVLAVGLLRLLEREAARDRVGARVEQRRGQRRVKRHRHLARAHSGRAPERRPSAPVGQRRQLTEQLGECLGCEDCVRTRAREPGHESNEDVQGGLEASREPEFARGLCGCIVCEVTFV